MTVFVFITGVLTGVVLVGGAMTFFFVREHKKLVARRAKEAEEFEKHMDKLLGGLGLEGKARRTLEH